MVFAGRVLLDRRRAPRGRHGALGQRQDHAAGRAERQGLLRPRLGAPHGGGQVGGRHEAPDGYHIILCNVI